MSLETRLNYILKTGLLKKLEPQKINILSIGVEAPGELLAVANYFNIEKTAITFQGYFKPFMDEAEGLGLNCTFSCKKKYDIVIVAIPSDKKEALGLISRSLKNIKEGGYIICDGFKTRGIDSIIKKLKFLNYKKVSKAHGKIILAEKPLKIPKCVSEWEMSLNFSLNQDNFVTSPGMFSYKKIDEGSKLLATFLKNKITGEVADLCSGWGYLSIATLQNNSKIKSIFLFEANYFALMASQINLKDVRAYFDWKDATKLDLAGKKFDCVICNPPFHSKAGYDIDIGKKIIESGYKILKLSGTFWMVANKQLPYEKTLKRLYSHVEKVTEDSYFKVFRATKPFAKL
tara:strand:- start:569 stop:1603 length:1035 start_codon:yes stop_codon:yes gene_type:complete